jgi:hypothetical protein
MSSSSSSAQKRKAGGIDLPSEKAARPTAASPGSSGGGGGGGGGGTKPAASAADDFDDDDNGDDDEVQQAGQGGEEQHFRTCPFLDTINRKRLDFDLAKQCSVSLVKQNVYVCLVCGGYFQGRGRHTHANSHSFQMGHHVFINLRNQQFFCLPDNYEVRARVCM